MQIVKRRVIAAIPLVFCLAGQALAQETITETEFLSVLTSGHPALSVLEGELAQAAGNRRTAGLLENPEFAIEHEAPSDAADQTTAKLAWKPPLDGRRGARVDASEARLEAAKANLESEKMSLRSTFRAVFTNWAVAAERARLLRVQFEQVSQVANRFQQRATRGEESGLAAQRLALAASEVRGDLAVAEAELAQARGGALALRGDLPAGVEPVLSELAPISPNLSAAERPDLLAQRNAVRATEFSKRLAGRVFEFPTLEFGWTRIDEQGTEFEGPSIGLSLELPLFDRNQGQRSAMTRLVAVEEARLELLESRAKAEFVAALEAYETLRESALLVENTVRNADEVADAAWASFSAGESTLTDLLETLRSVLGSQLAGLDLKARAHQAHRELELKVGRPLMGGK